ncbi:MAG TPA: slipin family protein [Oscillatoriaceae cyanobacterium]
MELSFLVIVIIALLFASVRIVQEYERGVIFRLGRLIGPKGPGLFFIVPVIDRMVRMDLRTLTFELPAQEVITRDNVTVKVTAVVYFRIVDPGAAVTRVADYRLATVQVAQTTLRNVLGQFVMDELLAERAQINVRLQQIIDEQTEPWGIKVSAVEIKDIELPANMQRAMARQAEAEREKRAKIILSEAELQAAQQLTEAAAKIAEQPIALQLRYLTTLYDISSEKTTTIVFPLPLDLLEVFMNSRKQG